MPTWPGTLPQAPDITGYQEDAPNTVIRTQMDAGSPKLRRRFTAGIRPLSMQFVLTKAQVATLETFYLTTLSGGALSFDWTHPRTTVAAVFRFVTNPSYVCLGPEAWQVTCRMEIVP